MASSGVPLKRFGYVWKSVRKGIAYSDVKLLMRFEIVSTETFYRKRKFWSALQPHVNAIRLYSNVSKKRFIVDISIDSDQTKTFQLERIENGFHVNPAFLTIIILYCPSSNRDHLFSTFSCGWFFFYFWCWTPLSAIFQLYHGDQF
jgi:hypothetical protein